MSVLSNQFNTSNNLPPNSGLSSLPMTDENLNYAQGLVAAMIAQMGPAFAYWWQQQQENQVAFSNASLESAVSSGKTQKWNGFVEGAGNGVAAGVGVGGIVSDVSSIKNTLQVNTTMDQQIAGVDSEIVRLQNSTDTLGMADAEVVNGQGTSAQIEQVDGVGNTNRKTLNTEKNKQQIARLKRERKTLEASKERQLNQIRSNHDRIERVVNPNSGIGPSLSKAMSSAVSGSLQENTTVQGQQGGVEKSASDYADQQLRSSVNVYEGMIRSMDGLFSVSQAIARA